jgi:hypothetical protein
MIDFRLGQSTVWPGVCVGDGRSGSTILTNHDGETISRKALGNNPKGIAAEVIIEGQ